MTAIVAMLALLIFSVVVRPQTTKQASTAAAESPDGSPPDLSGVWVSAAGTGIPIREGKQKEPVALEDNEADDEVFRHSPLPLQPWAEEKFKYNMSDQGPYASGRSELKPYITQCSPLGPTDDWQLRAFPFEIIQSPKRVLIMFERDHEIRQIWTDGREHPKDFGHNWMGHSIGHWEADTLVADTVGLNDLAWLDNAGHVHSDELHLVERLRRVEPGKLRLDITFDDPKAFTQPWTAFRYFYLKPNWELEEDILCEDRFLGKTVPLQ